MNQRTVIARYAYLSETGSSLVFFLLPIFYNDKMLVVRKVCFQCSCGYYFSNPFPQCYINFIWSRKQEHRTSENEMFTGAGTDNWAYLLLEVFVFLFCFLIIFRIMEKK